MPESATEVFFSNQVIASNIFLYGYAEISQRTRSSFNTFPKMGIGNMKRGMLNIYWMCLAPPSPPLPHTDVMSSHIELKRSMTFSRDEGQRWRVSQLMSLLNHPIVLCATNSSVGNMQQH